MLREGLGMWVGTRVGVVGVGMVQPRVAGVGVGGCKVPMRGLGARRGPGGGGRRPGTAVGPGGAGAVGPGRVEGAAQH